MSAWRKIGLRASTRMNAIAAALVQEGKVAPLHDLPAGELRSVKSQVVAAASGMFQEAQKRGRGGLFPIPPDMFDELHAADQQTRFSQLARLPDGTVHGFALVYYSSDHGTVHLEKLGVLADQRQGGLDRKMLWAMAAQAARFGLPALDLLVVKTNDLAIEAYEKLGFVNVTPAQSWDDPRYNAFRFAVPVETLLKRDPR